MGNVGVEGGSLAAAYLSCPLLRVREAFEFEIKVDMVRFVF